MAMIEVTGVAMPQTAAEVRTLARQAISKRRAAYYVPPPVPAPVIEEPVIVTSVDVPIVQEMPAKPFVPAWTQWAPTERDPAGREPTIREIQEATVRYFQNLGEPFTLRDLMSKRRTAAVVYPRQIAMYLCKKLTTKSLPEIGRRSGGRDHTTILHAVKKIGRLCTGDSPCALVHVAGVMDVLRSQGHPV